MYFGTDGIRGIANTQITTTLASRCGNALTIIKEKCKVLIGRDTRYSGEMLMHALASGIMQGGGEVIDVGIMPTAGIAYLTKVYKADFGIVISASHNPPEHNGIKIFDQDGYKLNEESEMQIEQAMASQKSVEPAKIGKYTFMHNAGDTYISFLMKDSIRLDGLKILVDCSNGASYDIAPRMWQMLGADVVAINTNHSGHDINENAGALHANLLSDKVVDGGYNMGFAYDGDSDRLIAVDELGGVVDGDKILYLLAKYFMDNNKLIPATVVGTSHTNMGVEKALSELGIELLRSDVGDKYVLEKMLSSGAKIGAEQSGHIVLLDHTTTGDGVLSSVIVANIVKLTGQKLSQLSGVKLYAQTNINIPVKDKIRVLNNEELARLVEEKKIELAGSGRLTVRASGTESKLRIMVESVDEAQSEKIARELEKFVISLNF